MKRSNKNQVVITTFIAEDEDDADRLLNEIYSFATDRGCHLLFTDVVAPQEHHIQASEELEVFDDCR